MVVIVTNGKHGKRVRFEGISNAMIALLSNEGLEQELGRIERELRDWTRAGKGMKACHANAPFRRAEYNCLMSEKRRVQAEIDRRGIDAYLAWLAAQAVPETASDPMMMGTRERVAVEAQL